MVLVALHCGGSLLPLSAFVFFLQGQHFSALSSQEAFSGGLLSWKWVAPPQSLPLEVSPFLSFLKCFFVWKWSVRLQRPWLAYDKVHSQSRHQACPFTSILRNRLPTRSFKTLSPSLISTSSDIHSHLQRFGQPWSSNFSPLFTMRYNPAIFANAKPCDPEAAELKTLSLYFCPH